MKSKKRLLSAAGTIATFGAIAALATGATFGFFSATSAPQSNKFTTGNVTMNSAATATCDVSHIVPGDSGTCKLKANYTGSEPAYMALDLSIVGHAVGNANNTNAYDVNNDVGVPVTGKNLFDGAASGNGLQLTLTDDHTGAQYLFSGTQWKTIGGTATNLTANDGAGGEADNLFAGSDTTGQTTEFTLGWSLPTTANNAYQDSSTTFRLQAHAAQSKNNTATNCVAGRQCSVPAWN